VSGGDVASLDRRSRLIARLERQPFSPFHLHLASILAVGTFFDAFDAITIAVALTVIFTALHIGFVNAGFLISAGYVGQFVGAWAFGYWSETYGRKIAFVTSMALFGVLSIATAFAWDFHSLLVLRLVQGFGLGGEVPAAAALFNEYLRARNRGRVALIYQSVFIWGAMLTPVIGLAVFALFGQDMGWRVLFLFGGLPLIDAVYAWFALPESVRWLLDHGRDDEAETILARIEAQPRRVALPPPQVRAEPAQQPTRLAELFSGIYLRRTILVWVQSAAAFFVAYGYNTWLPTLYVRIGHLPVNDALALSVVTWVVTLSTMYTQAWLVETIGRKTLFVFGFGVVALGGLGGALAVVMFHLTGWPMLFGVAVAMGLGIALNSSAAISYTAELYPTRMRGWGVATASSMNRLASIISPTAVGALLGSGFGVEAVFAMFGTVGLIGMIVMATLGIETKHRTLEELSP
jgi:MFS transporter, putative metabolite:H+ symporter